MSTPDPCATNAPDANAEIDEMGTNAADRTRERSASRDAGTAFLTACALLAFAISLRLPAFDGRPLWIDELWRAALILDPQFWHTYWFAQTSETAITSPLYALLVQFFALFSVSPNILRLSSFIPGTMAVVLAFAVVRRSGGGVAIATCAALTFALNAWFISYSNEMKPYMFEVCVHLACLFGWITLISRQTPTSRDWLAYFAVLFLALLATPTAVFVLPASGLALFVRCLMTWGRKSLKACTIGFAVLGAIALALYYVIWRHGADPGMINFWAAGFTPPGGSPIAFLASQFAAMWGAAFQTILLAPRQSALMFAGLVVVLAALLATGKVKQTPVRDILVFCSVLLATLSVLNLLKIWPLGASRQNLFLFSYAAAFFFLLAGQTPFAHRTAQAALICIGLFLVWHARSENGRAQYRALAGQITKLGAPVERSDLVIEDFSYRGPVGKSIMADCPRHQTLVVQDGYMASATRYYAGFDSAHRQGAALLEGHCVALVDYGAEAYQDPEKTTAILTHLLAKTSDAWFVFTHLREPEVAALRVVAQRFGRITQSRSYRGAGYFKLVMTPPRT